MTTSQSSYPPAQHAAYPSPGQADAPSRWEPPAPAARKRRWVHVVGYPMVLFAGIGLGAAAGGDADPSPRSGVSTEVAGPSSPAAGPSGPAASAPAASAEAPAPVPEPGSAKAAKPARGIGDKVRDGKFEFTVTKVRPGVASVGDSRFGKKAQGQFVLISIAVENIGDEPQSLLGDAQKLFDAEGREFSVDTEAAIYLPGSSSLFEEINPGNTLKGTLLFDIPDGMKPARLELHDSAFSDGVELALR